MKTFFAVLVLSLGLVQQAVACGGPSKNNTVAEFAAAYSNYLEVKAQDDGTIDAYATIRCMFSYQIDKVSRQDFNNCDMSWASVKDQCSDGKATGECAEAIASCFYQCPQAKFLAKNLDQLVVSFFQHSFKRCEEIRTSIRK